MRIPAGADVILANYSGSDGLQGRGVCRYSELYAGRLTETFRFGPGEIIVIDGPLGGTFPTREVPLTPIRSGPRVVGVSFVLKTSAGRPFLHLMMVEPFKKPDPIDPALRWPAHLHMLREKALALRAYDDLDIEEYFQYLG